MANPKPIITFTVNLANKESSSLPFSSNLVGNETITEYQSQINSRSTWLSTLGNSGKEEPGYGAGGNLAEKNENTIVAYGLNALYLKKNYASGKPDDVLKVVNIEW